MFFFQKTPFSGLSFCKFVSFSFKVIIREDKTRPYSLTLNFDLAFSTVFFSFQIFSNKIYSFSQNKVWSKFTQIVQVFLPPRIIAVSKLKHASSNLGMLLVNEAWTHAKTQNMSFSDTFECHTALS